MITKKMLGRLSAADLHRYRLVDVKVDTIKLLPGGFGPDDIQKTYLRWYELRAEFAETYQLPENAQWDIMLTTGAIMEDS